MNDSEDLIQKKQRAISLLRKHRGVLVALSGGVDSAVLLAIACEAVGPQNVLAVTGRSAAVTEQELDDAGRVARTLGARHEVVDTHELDRLAYRANSGDRCFHCRSELFATLANTASARGLEAIAYGAIVDDLGDHRPGMDAARQAGVLAPLLDVGICKQDVRKLAIEFNLHVHNKPANPCLASRIPVGTEVTAERLEQIRKAEAALRDLGFRVFRVRHHGDVARLEFAEGESDRLGNAAIRAEVVAAVERAGFRFVALDLKAFRTGSLNSSQPSGGFYSIEPSRVSGQ